MTTAVRALVICMGAALLEGLVAGRGVRARFRELRLPSYSPSLTIWFVIGGAYYLISYAILFRLLASGLPTPQHGTAFVIVLTLMGVNAGWGFLFFRRRDLRASFIAFFPYGLLAVMLAALLATVDSTALLLLLPYLGYLGYSTWWAYRLWKLNRDDGS